MYYPFLRGRQFELITIRELAEEQATQGLTIPIVEPVKKDHKNLDLAYKILAKNKQNVYIVLNPLEGDTKGDIDFHMDYLLSLGSQDTYLPAFHYHNNAKYIIQSIKNHDFHTCMILCKNNVLPDDNLKSVIGRNEVSVIIVEDPGRNRELNRYLRGSGKTYVRLDDHFEKEDRNMDYLKIQERRFSEEHIYYRDENFDGFSDYTVLSSEYTDSGTTPRAVVIHLTFLKPNGEIWIRSFTSETNDSIANVQGKFGEAAKKAVSFFEKNKFQNSAIRELVDYFNRGHYPGLGMIKKISIKNHLLVVADYLRK